MAERPEVPTEVLERLDAIPAAFPRCTAEDAWVGVRWRVGQATVAHVFGGEDQQLRVTYRADPDEVIAYEHLGEPHFRAGWGSDVVGMILDGRTDWTELAEGLTDSYCIQAPERLARAVLGRS